MRWKKTKREPMRTSRMNGFAWGMLFFLLIYVSLLLLPYVFAIVSSFKTLNDFIDNLFGWTKPTLENYRDVMEKFKYPVVMDNGSAGYYNFLGMSINSVLYALGGAFCATIIPCITAYCSAKFDFVIGKILTHLVYIIMALPLVGTTGASIEMTKMLGIHDTIPGMWFLKCSFLGMNYLLYYGNFKSIPSDYSEAAYMDGAGNFTIFFKLMLPMVGNLFGLQLLLGFLQMWADYTTPMFYLPSKPTLSLALLNFSSLNSTSITMQLAGCMLFSLPGIVLFIIFKDKFMGNIQMGGIKG